MTAAGKGLSISLTALALLAGLLIGCKQFNLFDVIQPENTLNALLAKKAVSITPSKVTLSAGGSVTFSATGGVGPYTFSLTSGGGTIEANTGLYQAPSAAGTATVAVTDSASSTSSATVTIVAAAPGQLAINPATVTLSTGGSISFTATGGKAPYSYTVTSGGGTVNASSGLYQAPSSVGSATVTATDSASATSSAAVTIVAGAAAPLAISPATVTLSTGGSITFTATGGTAPYSYHLTSGVGTIGASTGLYQAPSSAGSATVTVTDAASATSSASVTVVAGAAATLAISPANITLSVGGVVTFSASGGTPPYSYSLTAGGGTVNASTGLYQAPSSAGSATVTVTDAASAHAAATVTIVAAAPPPLAISPATVAVSTGGSITFSASGGTSPYTYSLTAGGGTVNASTGLYQAPSSAASATVTVTDAASAHAAATVTVIAAPPPPLAINPATITLSVGGIATFSASGGTPPYSYSLTAGGGTVNASTGLYQAPSSAASATVTVTDAASAHAAATVTVVAAAPPPLAISPATVALSTGGSVTFAAYGGTPPYSYAVTAGGGSVNSSTGVYQAPSTPGSATVTVSDAASATSAAAVTIEAIAATLAISPASAFVTTGTIFTFSASGGSAPYSFAVASGGGSIDSSTGVYQAPMTAGSAVVRVTDHLFDTSDAQVTIMAPPSTVAISPVAPAIGVTGMLNFTASGGTTPYTFSVLAGGDGGAINASTGVYHAPITSGTDTVRVTDAVGGVSDATVTIVAASQLLISPVSLTISSGNTYQFGATGGVAPYTFTLVSGGGSASSGGLYTAPGFASTVVVRVTDSALTTSDATISVVSTGPLAISPASASVPEGGTVTFAGSGGTPSYTFTIVAGGSGSIGAYSGTYTASGSVGAAAATVKLTDSVAASVTAPVDVVPAAPSDLTATPTSNHKEIDLSWSNHTADASSVIQVERQDGGSGSFVLVYTTAGASQTTYADTDPAINPGILYVYRVRAVHGTLNSPYSNQAFTVP